MRRYGLSLLILLITLVVRTLMEPFWETSAPFALFMLATTTTAWAAGRGPALLTGAGSLAARLYFDSPAGHGVFGLPIEENVRIALFAACCIGVVILFERMREDRRTLEASVARAQQEIAERRRAEAELRKARDAAEQANRLKDEFLALVSHELRTPLNAILGWVSLLRSGSLTPARSTHALDIIQRNATSQAQLVSDLLDVARSLTGRLQIEPQALDLGTAIDSAAGAVRAAAAARQVRLDVDVERPLQVWGDMDRLSQVVWNLLSNAVKFTPPGGLVRVTGRLRPSCAELVVEDSGIGIEPDFLPHIFDHFSQGDAGTTRRHGGAGLGLAIVRQIVELHGGSIVAESGGASQGSRFTIVLPLGAIASAAAARGSVRDVETDLPGGMLSV